MTLRTIESEFSNELLQASKEEFPLDLSLQGPLFTKPHPKLLWTKLQFQHNPQQEFPVTEIPGWHWRAFATLAEAQEAYPQISLSFEGRPWSFHQFLEGNYQEAIIDFSSLGTIVLSKKELKPKTQQGLHELLLPLWFNYATSPELWGPQGKWTRFHSRLETILKEHNLLKGEALVGYYPLLEKTKVLEKYGFVGSLLEKSYVLVLPWTFPLSALEKLEEVIRQEF